MLVNSFYSLLSFTIGGNKAKASIKINRDNPVFDGHFPDKPVVPGVCSIQIIQELAEKLCSKKLTLANADNIKFLNIINPDENPEVDIELTYEYIKEDIIDVRAEIMADKNILIKFRGQFKC